MIPDIEKTIQLAASPERVWRAITEAEEITAWFPQTIKWDQQIGSEGWFGWDQHGRYAVRIERLEPPSFMSWRWARKPDKPLAETDTTLVEWTLTPRADGASSSVIRRGPQIKTSGPAHRKSPPRWSAAPIVDRSTMVTWRSCCDSTRPSGAEEAGSRRAYEW